MALVWSARADPLPIRAAWYPQGRREGLRWARDPRRGLWRGLGDGDAALLIGPDLPWADGVSWLGVDPDAPTLLIPTQLQPDASIDLVALAIAARFPTVEPPFAVLPRQGRVLVASGASRLDPVVLADRAGER